MSRGSAGSGARMFSFPKRTPSLPQMCLGRLSQIDILVSPTGSGFCNQFDLNFAGLAAFKGMKFVTIKLHELSSSSLLANV